MQSFLTVLGLSDVNGALLDSRPGPQEGVVLVAFDAKKLSEANKAKIFQSAIVYTTAAFRESAETQTPESRKEHFEHIFNGDVLFIAIDTEKEVLRAHSLWAFAGHGAVYIVGTCVDPSLQRSGLGTALCTYAVTFTAWPVPVTIFCGRTQNVSFVKIWERCFVGDDWVEVVPVRGAMSNELAGVVRHIVHSFGSLKGSAEKYCDKTGTPCFRGVYDSVRIAAFGGDRPEGQALTVYGVDPRQGDALLVVARRK